MKSLGEKLIDLRKKAGKTQKEVAKFLNISYVGYGDYERNKSEPDVETILKLSDYFKVSPNSLLQNNDESKKEVVFSSEEVSKIIEVIDILNSKLK